MSGGETLDHGAGPMTARRSGRVMLARLAVAIAGLAVVGAVLICLGLTLEAWFAPPPAPRNPFGTGLREAAPAATGIGGFILAVQGEFYQLLIRAMRAMKDNGAAFWSLMAIGFAYGIFHAAGPGHGKSVIAGYIVASRQSLRRGLGLSAAAALLQAGVAIAIVAILARVIRATAATVSATANAIEVSSFGAVMLLGLVVLWRKAGNVVAIAGLGAPPRDCGEDCGQDCGHVHIPPPAELDRLRDWRDRAGVVLAAGIRPCAGAIIILVFALGQGLFAAGVAATLAMALGTAITTGALAALAVFMKRLALGIAGGRGRGPLVIAALEVLAAAFVALTGVALLSGLWASGGG
ncbi:ABC-type nickel/cobalt efflux system permease component RcnA [Chelatococcus asaccharovorans]|uniref:Nickel/cobalt efflux system n=2 Tax=Chelatococcus asaccharovorans TaxID=28210 RepID=A0A2V3TY89_9HYPH|nr:ABC-type nickel/cobalt efflux system permease component RcnA [Chelatococcus asaccharovorans]